jgi:thiol-disulfide isomerase/thioredoxin
MHALGRAQRRVLCRSSEADAVAASPQGWWTKDVPENVTRISTVQELVDELSEASKNDQLVVLEVFAPWCGACKALFHKMKKLCVQHSNVRFLLLNFEDNRKLAKGLGVKVLPYFHFYRGPSGRVGEMTCSISKIARLKEAIEVHTSPRCYTNLRGIEDVLLREYPDVIPSGATSIDASSNSSEEEQHGPVTTCGRM